VGCGGSRPLAQTQPGARLRNSPSLQTPPRQAAFLLYGIALNGQSQHSKHAMPFSAGLLE
ncbi:MAG TPA: hypothetical protein VMB80_16875, partial [Candidatus Acidoferrum sp.]|nr:hypothetical protein [Candidatus Acidoferrum sp.]